LILFLLKYTFTIIKPKYARFFVKCLSFLIGGVDNSWLYTDNHGTWIGKNIRSDKEDRIVKSDIVILWVPGGGFRVNLGKLYYSTFVHWLSQMEIQNIKCTILVANYRLSPEYKYPTATEDVAKTHEWLLNTMNIPNHNIIWGADDAGASIVLDALYKRLKVDQVPRPAGLILSSPYIGMDPGGKSWQDNYGIDIINEKSVEMMENTYINQKGSNFDSDNEDDDDDDNNEEPFSYLDKSAQLSKYLPASVLIEIGEQEVLFDDAELLVKMIRDSKTHDSDSHTTATLIKSPNQKHLWTLL
ncbi:Alpha/Beta hydrolase protein, partial [Cunninghamella echinulata]